MGVEIRRYAEADADATLAVFHRAVRITGAAMYSAEQVAAWSPDNADRVAWAARRRAVPTWVAVDDGQVVAFIDLDDTGHIDMTFVDPDVGRRGIGSALIAIVLDAAADHGLGEVTVDASLVARPVFERHGFTVVTEQSVPVRGQVLTNFSMVRPLP